MTYAQQLAALTQCALREGVAPAEIIQALELVKLEIGFQMFIDARMGDSSDEIPTIIKPGS